MLLRKWIRAYMPDFIIGMYRKLKRYICRMKWRKNNKHNGTVLKNVVDISLIDVGNYTYGDLDVLASPKMDVKLKIGCFCSIASDVKFFLSGNHEMNAISTFPFDVRIRGGMPVGLSNGNIIVGDDVWFGQRAMIMSGVNIGQGAVIGAGAIVANDIPPYAVVGGVPAKIIRYRFSEDIIQELLKIDYSKWDVQFIESHISELSTPVNVENIKKVVRDTNNFFLSQ